jgi:hypothetical protein
VEGSTAIISRGDRLGIETTWNCSCDKGEGTCSMESAEGRLACTKGSSDTCNGDCYLSMEGVGITPSDGQKQK